MKTKVTRSEVYKYHNKVISIGYCAAYYLLIGEEAVGYNAGVYGWNYDLYSIGSTAIVTGYRPIGEHVDYTILDRYEAEAKSIYEDRSRSYEDRIAAIKQLLSDFIHEV